MACVTGGSNTLMLADDKTLYSFGQYSPFPTSIANLPKIKLVSCGSSFTVCVDCEGSMWSFGTNSYGELGTGNTAHININTPQKIQDIPPILSVACGTNHTLIITNDSNLWSCGFNNYGQLCLANNNQQVSKPQKTSNENIIKVSAGGNHTLFQNNKGEIFGCGCNKNGEVALGTFTSLSMVTLIPNLPPNIVKFVCGRNQNLFLDSEGNVFSVGGNSYGQLGLGHNSNQSALNKIPNIPPIKVISCLGYSSYLLDFDGNVWSFGYNNIGQLGHGDNKNLNIPTVVNSLNDVKIQQISSGSSGQYFFAKNSQNKIFAPSINNYIRIFPGNTPSNLTIKEIDSKYFNIWGNSKIPNQWNRKCFGTTMNWTKEEIVKLEMIQLKIRKVKLNLESNNNDKSKQEFPQNSFETWNEVQEFLNEKSEQINAKWNQKNEIDVQTRTNVETYEKELKEIEDSIQQLQERKKHIEENLVCAKKSRISFEKCFSDIENNQKTLEELCIDVSKFCKNENEMNQEVKNLFEKKKFEEFDSAEISKVLWKMDLAKYQSVFDDNQINGAIVAAADNEALWKQLGFTKKDCFSFSYYFKLMQSPGYLRTFSPDYKHDCYVCSHTTPEKTIHLLKEHDIPIEDELILKHSYNAPMLISKIFLEEVLGKDSFSQNGIQIMFKLQEWKKNHKQHLKELHKI